MWSRNPDPSTWHQVLDSIDNAIPKGLVCCKYLVDASDKRVSSCHSQAQAHGWKIIPAKLTRIPEQANQALDLVHTEYFASFEQDVIINPNWGSRMIKLIQEPDVAVVQGMRRMVGSKPLERWDLYSFSTGKIPHWTYSIDNNLYNTKIVRSLGGFPTDCPYTADGLLRRNVLDAGYQWKVDNQTVSYHLRPSFRKYLKHLIRIYATSKIIWESYDRKYDNERLEKLVLVFPLAGRIAGIMHTPQILITVPMTKFVKTVTKAIYLSHGNKRILAVRSS